MAVLWIHVTGCSFKAKYLPDVTVPYVSEIEFLKEVQPTESGMEKTHFKNNLIQSPFFIYLKINSVENNGMVLVKFYQREQLYAPSVLYQIWSMLQQSSIFSAHLSKKKNPFVTFICSPAANVTAFESNVLSLFRQFHVGFYFLLSSCLANPLVLNLNHFFSPHSKSIKEIVFRYGVMGKYYEHIIFIDKVSGLNPGQYRYTVFINRFLTFEGYLTIFPKKG